MKIKKIHIGIVGCGNIAEKYLEQISNYNTSSIYGSDYGEENLSDGTIYSDDE